MAIARSVMELAVQHVLVWHLDRYRPEILQDLDDLRPREPSDETEARGPVATEGAAVSMDGETLLSVFIQRMEGGTLTAFSPWAYA